MASNSGGAGFGGGAVRHRRQRCDIDEHRFGRILRQRRALRHDHRQRLADIAHLAGGDHRLLEGREDVELLLPQRNGRYGPDVGGGDHGVDARALARRRGVDRDDAAMGDRAAQDHRMEQAGPRDVVDISSRDRAGTAGPRPVRSGCR